MFVQRATCTVPSVALRMEPGNATAYAMQITLSITRRNSATVRMTGALVALDFVKANSFVDSNIVLVLLQQYAPNTVPSDV